MALPAKQTLGGLRFRLQARLGFRAQTSGPNIDLLNDFLQQAQWELYWFADWIELRKTKEQVVGSDQILYDWPDDCEPDRLLTDERGYAMWSDEYPQSTVNWRPMEEGIDQIHYNSNTNASRPLRFERGEQIEIWPPPDLAGYVFRFEYIKRLERFTQDNDTVTLSDDGLILLHAIANAKAHYSHPDADRYSSQLVSMLRQIKSKMKGNKKHIRRPGSSRSNERTWVRPKLIT